MYKITWILILVLMGLITAASAQESPGTIDRITGFPDKFFNKVNAKADKLQTGIEKQTKKYLTRLARREKKLQRKLSKIDSAAATKLFANGAESYSKLINKISDSAITTNGRLRGEYLPYADSLKTSLSFLQQNNNLLASSKDIQEKIGSSLAGVNQLQDRLQQTEAVKTFIRQRKQQIKDALSRYTNLPKSITKQYNEFSRELYYYSQQVKEYKDMLNDPDKLTKKALSLLSKTSVFQKFMQEHSQLAGLFAVPANYGTPQSLAGLQTRSQVQQLIQTQLASAGPNLPAGQAGAQQMLQQNLQAAQAQLNTLKDKINKLGGDAAADMPDLPAGQAGFKPNNQKTKSFWKRLEYGTNLQTTKGNYLFVNTSDIGLSVGYKLNDKSIIGVGGSYKLGLGTGWSNIRFSNQGAGLRSFLDVKIKGSFYFSGGFEYNYQPLADSISTTGGIQDANPSAWTQSGLIGISRVLSFSSPKRGRPGGGFFKKTKIQLFWDPLSYSQTPRTQAVKFRVGYNF